ncbi:MAG: methionyl-tRNA formyltransferase [Actinomycetes bacterium]
MRLIFAGTPETALPSLDAVWSSHHELVAVISRPDAAKGRGRDLSPSPVAVRASELGGVPVLKPPSLRDPVFAQEFNELDADCCPVVAYGGMVPHNLLGGPRHGWVNLHFSLLPAWRGAAPVQHAILAGDEFTGATTFRLTDGLDTGPVFGTLTEPVRPDDTTGTLLDRLAVSGAELLLRTLDAIETGTVVAHDQPTVGVSMAPKLTKDDARVRWDEPALAIERRIRACTPHPGAWTQHRGDRIGLLPLLGSSAPDRSALRPGEVRVTKHDVSVGSASGEVRLGHVKPAGKREMLAADWARGVRLVDGELLT